MVIGRALRPTGCASCRLILLRTFTAIAGPLPRTQLVNTRHSYPKRTPQVRFSTSTSDYGEHRDHTRGFQGTRVTEEGEKNDVQKEALFSGDHDRAFQGTRAEEGEDEDVKEEAILSASESTQMSAVPWYLEVNPSQRAPRPLSEKQRIPDLPESPPPILAPLLQQVSVDLGMDSLTLIDLRRLDPPPALGAHLIMLIGTARSEKHLHVSADRLCRWLRSTYKLRPDADGLLGRNELKLKLKRKSKRNKLLGKSTADSDDDGVRTGWVCVDVGVVEGVENSITPVPEPAGFVGFGRRTDGVRLVVQMLTEEKREQMELERLWNGILRRGVPAELDSLEPVEESQGSESRSQL